MKSPLVLPSQAVPVPASIDDLITPNIDCATAQQLAVALEAGKIDVDEGSKLIKHLLEEMEHQDFCPFRALLTVEEVRKNVWNP